MKHWSWTICGPLTEEADHSLGSPDNVYIWERKQLNKFQLIKNNGLAQV